MSTRGWTGPLAVRVITASLSIAALAGPAAARTAPLVWQERAIEIDSGLVRNNGSATTGEAIELLFSTVVTVPGADWMRLEFADVRLAGGRRDARRSFLVLTSLEDGADQVLHAQSLREWRNMSAYLNGDGVRIELFGTPESGDARVRIVGAWAGEPSFGGPPESQCGPTDDRVPSNDARTGRLLPVGCTGFLLAGGTDSCALTAGHCTADEGVFDPTELVTFEFNVPASNPDGSINMADPDDQYPVDQASIQFFDDGSGSNGNDWCYYGTFVNSNTGLFPRVAQGVTGFTVPGVQPTLDSTTINIWGYGLDFDQLTRSQTQQFDSGLYDLTDSASVFYNDIDTEGGNSGSPVFKVNTSQIVAIHTNAGCTTGGSGNNSGTRIDNAGLQNALANPIGICAGPFCGDSAAGSCYEINGNRGCNNSGCCQTVCADDPYCCNTNWDGICVGEAFDLCGNCGDFGAGDCFASNGTAGCDIDDCCQAVCVADPFCCNSFWDGICANEAFDLCALNAPAPCSVDQDQTSDTICMANFGQPDLAQSFVPTTNRVTGAGIFLRDATPQETVDVTIELWDGLPNAGGTMLASATASGTEGHWVDVLYGQIPVVPGNTYYLVFTSTAGSDICIAGDTTDPYPFGNVFANSGYNPFPTFDYTFRTCGEDACDPPFDVNQPSNIVCMANFSQTDLAQSFRPTVNRISGAGIVLHSSAGGTGNITIELWTGLPNAGGNFITSGTGLGGAGTWVDVSWPAVAVEPGDEYVLVLLSDNLSLCVAGDHLTDPYPDGQVYANAGFQPFPTFDYTFRTCGFNVDCTTDVNQPSNASCMAAFTQADLAQSFQPTTGTINGAGIYLRSHAGAPFTANVTIQLWTNLPNAGGALLASGTALGSADAWLDVAWAPTAVTPGSTYYLVFFADQTTMCVGGDTSNPYPGGQVYANAGFQPFPGFDYTFRTCGVSSCPWDCDGSGDGAVNVSDLLALLGQYDTTNPPCNGGGSCDYNGNGCVDVADLLKLLGHYDPAGIGCP